MATRFGKTTDNLPLQGVEGNRRDVVLSSGDQDLGLLSILSIELTSAKLVGLVGLPLTASKEEDHRRQLKELMFSSSPLLLLLLVLNMEGLSLSQEDEE